MTQQARNLAMALDDRSTAIRILIRDRDMKFSGPFDEVVRSAGARVILTPVRAPNANAYAERVIETIRVECLDWTLILGRRHLDRTLRTYTEHYNRGRPHRGLALVPPLSEGSRHAYRSFAAMPAHPNVEFPSLSPVDSVGRLELGHLERFA